MSFSYENQGANTYLVYTIEPGDTIDTMSLGMLTNNKIQGLASTFYMQMDNAKFIKYNVSSKISVTQFFEGQVNKKRLLGVFNGIVNALISAEEYMIDINSLLLNLDYIYADVSSCEAMLVCLPIVEKNDNPSLGAFFKTIMFNTRFDQTENCDYVATIINYLNSNPVFSINAFKQIIESLNSQTNKSTTIRPSIPSNDGMSQSNMRAESVRSEIRPNTGIPTQKHTVQPVVSYQQPVVTAPKKTTTSAQPIAQQFSVPHSIGEKQRSNASIPATEGIYSTTNSEEKKITMFGLLMHYSKENKELYKAQKERSKTQKEASARSAKKTEQNHLASTNGVSGTGFAVPSVQNVSIQSISNPAVSIPPNQPLSGNQQTMSRASHNIGTVSSPSTLNEPPVTASVGARTQVSVSFGETTILDGGIGETTVLGGGGTNNVQVTPHLIRAKNGEKILINKPVFRIGKERSYVDYFIGDNTAISRSHANIVNRDGCFYIVDTNSTNHTFVNGGMIQSNVETAINHGAKIRLANEEFEFRLY